MTQKRTTYFKLHTILDHNGSYRAIKGGETGWTDNEPEMA